MVNVWERRLVSYLDCVTDVLRDFWIALVSMMLLDWLWENWLVGPYLMVR